MAVTRTADSWRLSELILVQPWKAATTMMTGLWAWMRPGRGEIRVSRLSREWLRQHEIESLKHRDLH